MSEFGEETGIWVRLGLSVYRGFIGVSTDEDVIIREFFPKGKVEIGDLRCVLCIVSNIIGFGRMVNVDVSVTFTGGRSEMDREWCSTIIDDMDGISEWGRRYFKPAVGLIFSINLDFIGVAVVALHLSTGREGRSGCGRGRACIFGGWHSFFCFIVVYKKR